MQNTHNIHRGQTVTMTGADFFAPLFDEPCVITELRCVGLVSFLADEITHTLLCIFTQWVEFCDNLLFERANIG